MYKKILLAADGSDHSLRAADHAVSLAKYHEDASVCIVCVIDPEEMKSEVLHNWQSLDIRARRKARLQPIEDKCAAASVSYEVVMLHGKPGPTIVEYANQEQFDLVVIGSRGLNTLQEFVLGSVSHKVAKRAHCPVLIIK